MRHLIPYTLSFIFCIFLSCAGDKNEKRTTAEVKKDSSELKLEDINNKLKNDPNNADLLNKRATIFIMQRNYAGALGDIENALQKDSSKPEYYLTAASVNFFTGKTSRSKYYLERCTIRFPEYVEGLMKLAELYLYVKQNKESIKVLDKVLRINKYNAKAYFMKGMNFKELGDTSLAISSFQTCVEQDQEYYNAYIQLGLIHAARRNPLAIDYYNNALNLNPKSEEAHYNLGMFYLETENLNKAIEKFTTLTQLNPQNREAHFNLGFIHFEYLKVYDQAIKHFDAAIKADPEFARAYYYRGLCYEAKGDLPNAKENYNAALRINPDYEMAKDAIQRIGV